MYPGPNDWLAFVSPSTDIEEGRGPPRLRIEIPADRLQALLEEGKLCAADLRCLDRETKQVLQRLCLENCARCMKAGDCDLPRKGVERRRTEVADA